MGTIVLSSTGTLGDYLPFIALGATLAQRGHQIRLAVNESVHPFARALGLDPLSCGQRFGADEARRIPRAFDEWRSDTNDAASEDAWERTDLEGNFRDLEAAARGADLLVASSIQAAAPMVHEATGIPWATVFLMPWQLDEIAAEMDDEACQAPQQTEFDLWYADVRKRVGLSASEPEELRKNRWSERRLLAASRHFAEIPSKVAAKFVQTGFIFYRDPAHQAFSPDPELSDFIAKPPGPVVLTLSSLAVEDARRFLAVHIEAAAIAGLRLLIQSGWAGFSAEDLPSSARKERVRIEKEFLPHDWLLPKAAAVVTHGGIGTVAQSLAAGCPLVIEPFGNDQIFNARRVKELGVGVALHPHRLMATHLARTLQERVIAEDVQTRARALGAKIAAENGIDDAADMIETWLNSDARR